MTASPRLERLVPLLIVVLLVVVVLTGLGEFDVPDGWTWD